jgi:branched-chain amino acid transport system permease protein
MHFGFAGLLNFGIAGFMAIGAYGYAISVLTFGFPWWLGMIIGVLGSIAFAILLGVPTLRLRGDYLAIVTIAAAEIARLLFLTTAFTDVTGSADGLLGDALSRESVRTRTLFAHSVRTSSPTRCRR